MELHDNKKIFVSKNPISETHQKWSALKNQKIFKVYQISLYCLFQIKNRISVTLFLTEIACTYLLRKLWVGSLELFWFFYNKNMTLVNWKASPTKIKGRSKYLITSYFQELFLRGFPSFFSTFWCRQDKLTKWDVMSKVIS